ncbi:MAG TPA: hypothetical protein VE082_02455 [Desulfobaccales bacterium]|jgi:hypothetical protein|nr:hypothetical protein [Desulfobaccales bacterium]
MIILERLLGKNLGSGGKQKDFPESGSPEKDPWDNEVIAILEQKDPAIAALIKEKQPRLSGAY